MSKHLGVIIGCKDKTSSWHLIGFPDRSNIGEKPTVILVLYTYINRHAGPPSKTKTKGTMSLDYSSICFIGSRIGWVSAILYYPLISHQVSCSYSYSYYYRLTRQETRFCFCLFRIPLLHRWASAGAVALFHTQPSHDTIMRHLCGSKSVRFYVT